MTDAEEPEGRLERLREELSTLKADVGSLEHDLALRASKAAQVRQMIEDAKADALLAEDVTAALRVKVEEIRALGVDAASALGARLAAAALSLSKPADPRKDERDNPPLTPEDRRMLIQVITTSVDHTEKTQQAHSVSGIATVTAVAVLSLSAMSETDSGRFGIAAAAALVICVTLGVFLWSHLRSVRWLEHCHESLDELAVTFRSSVVGLRAKPVERQEWVAWREREKSREKAPKRTPGDGAPPPEPPVYWRDSRLRAFGVVALSVIGGLFVASWLGVPLKLTAKNAKHELESRKPSSSSATAAPSSAPPASSGPTPAPSSSGALSPQGASSTHHGP